MYLDVPGYIGMYREIAGGIDVLGGAWKSRELSVASVCTARCQEVPEVVWVPVLRSVLPRISALRSYRTYYRMER